MLYEVITGDIAGKYLIPGETQDTAIMFVPSESIYADLHEYFDDVIQNRITSYNVCYTKLLRLLSFRLNDMAPIPGGPGGATWWDKVDSKFKGWDEARFRAAGFRAVPNCIVRIV